MQDITIQDMDEWREFVAANYDEVIAAARTVTNAEIAACQGGLVIGGGAAPLFCVTFAA
jgi:hypothetical protein